MPSLDKLDNVFGKILKKRRHREALSQEAFAPLAKLSRSYLSDLETGKKDPSLFSVFKIAKALRLNPSVLIGEVEREI
jgi:transcriptional regulator with XRE-family HTH domain